jgi:hypothetical protein
MNPDRGRVTNRLASAAPPHASNFRFKGDEHSTRVNGIDSLALEFPGPVRFHGRHCQSGHEDEAILIESQGDEAPGQEVLWCPPRGVLLVCVRSRLPFTWFYAPPIFVPKLKV